MAVEVKAEVSDSRDVTDEYFDLRARLDNQEATEEALLKLLGRAETVEAALKVQQTLTGVQEEVERLQGKIKLLEETSAFSLVSVNLELEPVDMAVEEIADKTTGVGERVRFRAFFKPPEGIEDFSYTWDFGDGESIRGHQTAPTEKEDTRVAATVTHRYRDEEDSPYIVQFEIQGSGERSGCRRRRGGRVQWVLHSAAGSERGRVQVGLRRRLRACHGNAGSGDHHRRSDSCL